MQNFSKNQYKMRMIHVDGQLLFLISILISCGFVILYSASNENMAMIFRQGMRVLLASFIMLGMAMVPPHKYKIITPWVYTAGLILLFAVMAIGKVGKGAQRWLDLGFFRFQPSEIMKLAVPMMTAWYFSELKNKLNLKNLFIAALIIFVPGLLIAKQPDLGTAIMVIMSGLIVVFVAGISYKILLSLAGAIGIAVPFIWQHMHDYQKQRIYTLINPEADPLGSGYHIIQSKIAIGSGGVYGKGWLLGTQSHLNFLPEHATDFIFAVCGEEFGFIGGVIIILLFLLITLRGLKITQRAQTTFTQLLAASIIMTLFFSVFVNIGMVMGILPVVGIPLPLISYGGTAMVTFMANFGILMSISSHRILFTAVF
jgi:rod shape determining protein RodA